MLKTLETCLGYETLWTETLVFSSWKYIILKHCLPDFILLLSYKGWCCEQYKLLIRHVIFFASNSYTIVFGREMSVNIMPLFVVHNKGLLLMPTTVVSVCLILVLLLLLLGLDVNSQMNCRWYGTCQT